MPFVQMDIGKQPLRVLVYGQPGVGKTAFAARAALHPELQPVGIADIERGAKTVPELSGKLMYAEPNTTDELVNDLKPIIEVNGTKLKALIIDSLSALHRNEVRASAVRRGDPTFLSPQDYGVAQTREARLMDMITKASMHQIFTALPREDVKDVNGVPTPQRMRPDLTPAFWNEVAGRMDMIFYVLRTKDGHIRLMYREYIMPNNYTFVAKCRGDGMLRGLDEFAKKQGLTNPAYPNTIVLGSVIDPSIPQIGFEVLYTIYLESLKG